MEKVTHTEGAGRMSQDQAEYMAKWVGSELTREGQLRAAEAQARTLAALLAEYFEDFEETAEARAKNETYARRCSAALRPMGYDLRNVFDEESERERADWANREYRISSP